MKDSLLLKLSAWGTKQKIGFYITSLGMIIMLFWAGLYKTTPPGANGIIPLVTNSPLLSWHFKLFGASLGSGLIGATEITCALLISIGLFKPQAGVIGGAIGVVIFFLTSSMLVSTPNTLTHVKGIAYLDDLGLFLFKDIISLGASFYLLGYFGKQVIDNNKKSL